MGGIASGARRSAVLAFVVSAIAALACFGGVSAQQAYADDVTLYDPTQVTLTKVLEADPSINTNGLAFSFTFAKQADTDNGTTTAAEAPNIADITLTAAVMSSDTQLLKQTGFIPQASAFPHAGTYMYQVYESAVPITHPSGATPATSEALYLMRIYVDNEVSGDNYTGNLTIRGVTVERTAADLDPSRQALEKVNPVPSGDTDAGGFAFTNVYTKSADLTVSKAVKGAAADRTKHFSYSMSFTIPSTSLKNATQTFVGTIKSTSGTTVDPSDGGHADGTSVTFTVAANALTSDTKTFQLCDGEQLVVSLPAGTVYVVTETGAAGYSPQATITNVFDSDTVSGSTPANATAGSNLTVNEGVTGGMPGMTHALNVVPSGGGTVAFTNAYTAPTPTGIIVANLPYILLIGIPVVAVIAWFAVRRRRAVQL